MRRAVQARVGGVRRPVTKWRSPHEWWDERDREWVGGGGVEPKPGDDFSECVAPHMSCPNQPDVECFGAGCNTQGCLHD